MSTAVTEQASHQATSLKLALIADPPSYGNNAETHSQRGWREAARGVDGFPLGEGGEVCTVRQIIERSLYREDYCIVTLR
jgi:hypothetical protein